MRKAVLGLLLLAVAPLTVGAQEHELKISAEVAPFVEQGTKAIALEAVRIAFDAGADVNATNEDGLTAIHGAASNGADGVVQFLVSKGAKMDVRDKYQQTPLSIATGVRLPWIPNGDELGEIIQPSTRDLLLKLGATPLDTPGYFKPPKEDSEAYRVNRGVRGIK